ncbi:PIN domain-containing protein [Fulvimarina endophytica]|uniref:PIN domain-containing protein n=1 Tax=Fulvimarina endophytica TaxID=2293836 RepID=A0A371X0V3_9HYPH|nr:PIN domain-containing protein [Fulvimarina endophytica]RFC62843.1 PIN domain-containing protein [Fulvimarina endophytica]
MIEGADVFLDTGVLLYAASGRKAAYDKWEIAQGLLTTRFGTSAQVLSEFYSSAVAKGTHPLSRGDAARWIALLSQKPFVAIDADIVRLGAEHSENYEISYWHGAILAAAERLGARTLYSEDLGHDRTYGSVTAINPFLRT